MVVLIFQRVTPIVSHPLTRPDDRGVTHEDSGQTDATKPHYHCRFSKRSNLLPPDVRRQGVSRVSQFITATRGRKVDCLARRDQPCCSISSILRRCAGRQRPVQSLRTRYPQSPDWHLNREGTVSLSAAGGDGAGWRVW